MSENNKENKDVLNSLDIDEILNGTNDKEYLNEDDIMEDISSEGESIEESGPKIVFDDISLDDKIEEPTIERKSMLDMLEDEGSLIDDESSSDGEQSFNEDDSISFEDEENETLSIEDEEDEFDDIISIEDDELEDENDDDDFDLMGDMLSTVDNELTNHEVENLQNEINKANEALDDINNDDVEEDYNYSASELDEKRNNGKNKQEKMIKIGVGIAALVLIVVLALLINMLVNKPNKNTEITPTPSPSPIVTTTPIPTKKPIDDDKQGMVDDVIGDIDKPTVIPTPTEAPIEEDISVLKNYRGYIIDIKDDTLYVATLTYDRYQTLYNEFNNFYRYPETEFLVWIDEVGKTYHKPNCDKFEKEGEENPDETLLQKKEMLLSDAKANEFTACECVDDTLLVKTDVDVKDFDYSLYPNLDGVMYVSLNISPYSNIFTDDELLIGDEVTVTYMQDNESLLNELIELKEVNAINNDISDNPINDDNKQDVEKDKNTNYWGDDWNNIVESIKNRRDEEERLEQEGVGGITNVNGDLIITTTEKFESVSTPITIGSASIVWFKIAWKANGDITDVPSSEDVAVELLTPNSSLITNENIDDYGQMWIDDATGLVNIILRNTVAGTYEVVFTKEVGTYLGDVEIEVIPITGFLQIEKASAVYTNGRLEVIWQATGVADDHCIVEVYAINGNKQTLLYSANSIDDGIHTVDMASINVSKVAGNTYDIVIRVTDIDVSASKPYSIVSTYLSDTVKIENVEIPEFRK